MSGFSDATPAQERYAAMEWLAKLIAYPSFSQGYGGLTASQALQKLTADLQPAINQLRLETTTLSRSLGQLENTSPRDEEAIKTLRNQLEAAYQQLFSRTTELSFGTKAFGILDRYGYQFGNEYFNDSEKKFFNAIQLLPVNPSQGGHAILLVRGTSEVPEDVVSDVNPFGVGMDQIYSDPARLSVNATVSDLLADLADLAQQGIPIDITGHSLGGALSQLIAIEAGRRRIPIHELALFNSPGISRRVLNSVSTPLLSASLGQATYFQVEGDLVQMAGETYIPGRVNLIQMAERNLVWRHNPVLLDDAGWGLGTTAISLPGRVGEPSYKQVQVVSSESSRWLGSGLFNYFSELQRDGDYVHTILGFAAALDLFKFTHFTNPSSTVTGQNLRLRFTALRREAEAMIRSRYPDGRSELFTFLDGLSNTLSALPDSLAATLSFRGTTEVSRRSVGGPLPTLVKLLPTDPELQARILSEAGYIAGKLLLQNSDFVSLHQKNLSRILRLQFAPTLAPSPADPNLAVWVQRALANGGNRLRASQPWLSDSFNDLQRNLQQALDSVPQLQFAGRLDLSAVGSGLQQGVNQLVNLLRLLGPEAGLPLLRELTFQLLADGGVPLADRDGNQRVDSQDIGLSLINGNQDLILDLRLGGVLAANRFRFDNDRLDPLLGLDYSAGLAGEVRYGVDLSIGLSSNLDPYLNLANPVGADLNLGLQLLSPPQSTTLGPYTFSLTNNGSGINGQIRLDLNEGEDSDQDNRLEAGEELRWDRDLSLTSTLDLDLAARHLTPFQFNLFGQPYSFRLPGVSTNVKLDSAWTASSNRSRTSLGFYDTEVDLGSLRSFLEPVNGLLRKYAQAARPVLEFLNYRPLQPLVSFWIDNKLPVPEGRTAASLGTITTYSLLRNLIPEDFSSLRDNLDNVYRAANDILALANVIGGFFGTNFDGSDSGILVGDLVFQDLENLAAPQLNPGRELASLADLIGRWQLDNGKTSPGSNVLGEFVDALVSRGSTVAQRLPVAQNFQQSGGQIKLKLPLLERPESALGLLLGLPVDLFQLDIEPVSFRWNQDINLGSIDLISLFGIPPVAGRPNLGELQVGLTGTLDLILGAEGPEFGLDTFGVQTLLRQKNTNLAAAFFDGLYATTRPLVRVIGQGGPFAQLNLASAGGEALGELARLELLLKAAIELGLVDVDGDRKFRLKEWNSSNPLANFNGKADLELRVKGTILGIEDAPVVDQTLLPLGSFPINANPSATSRSPILSERLGVTTPSPLRALSGPLASRMQVFDDSRSIATFDGDDAIRFNELNGRISLRINNWTQNGIDPATINRVDAEGGRGDDQLLVSNSWSRPVRFHGDTAAASTGSSPLVPGDDTLIGGSGADSLSGGGGHDQLEGRSGNDQLQGGDGEDRLLAGAGTNTLTGGSGNDRFQIEGSGDVILDLDLAADSFSVAAAARFRAQLNRPMQATDASRNNGLVELNTAASIDLSALWQGSGRVALRSTTNSDLQLIGSQLNDTISGGGGNDSLDGQGGSNTLSGGGGNDTFVVQASVGQTGLPASGAAPGSTAGTTADPAGSSTTILDLGLGGSEALQVLPDGRVFAEVVSAWIADGRTINRGSSELRSVGAAIDLRNSNPDSAGFRLVASAARTAVSLQGSTGGDTLLGGSGTDALDGHRGDDSLSGGLGNDSFLISAGRDRITDLGLGSDALVVAAGAELQATLAQPWTATAQSRNDGSALLQTSGLALRLGNAGGSRGFTLENSGGATTLQGSRLADVVIAGSGGDSLSGGTGSDRFQIRAGSHTLSDLDEQDSLEVSSGAALTARLRTSWRNGATTRNDGTVTLQTPGLAVDVSTSGGSSGYRVETLGVIGTNLIGSPQGDTLQGGGGNDRLDGQGGSNLLRGGGGQDLFLVPSAFSQVGDLGLGGLDVLQISPQARLEADVVAPWSADGRSFNRGTATLRSRGAGIDLRRAAADTIGFTLSASQASQAVGLFGSAGRDSLFGGGGNDNLDGDRSDDSLSGAGGNDRFLISTGNDRIGDLGFDGDALVVAAGAQVVANVSQAWTATAQSRNDGTALLQTSGLAINLSNVSGSRGFTLQNSGGATSLQGSRLADVVIAGNGGDSLSGGSGSDRFQIRTGSHTINDLDEQDNFEVSAGASLTARVRAPWLPTALSRNDGSVTIQTPAIPVNLAATSGSRGYRVENLGPAGTNLTGSRLDDVLVGAAGNDVLIPLAGSDLAVGGEGDDTARFGWEGTAVLDVFDAHTGTDLLILDWGAATGDIHRTFLGNVGFRYSSRLPLAGAAQSQQVEYYNGDRFQLTGGSGNDELFGADLSDRLSGGSGEDRLYGFGGPGFFDGGLGTDLVVASVASTAATPFALNLAAAQNAIVNVNAGTPLQTGWKGIEFVHITAGGGDDRLDLRGIRAEASRLNRDGWDPVQAGNIFVGGEGNDTFAIDLGSTGQHSFDAHTGTDLLILDWSAATGDIRRTFLGNVGFRYSTNLTRNGVVEEQRVEYFNGDQFQLTGGAGNDELFGGDLSDRLSGGSGEDRLFGFGGPGFFDGGLGTDLVVASVASTATTPFALNLAAAQSASVNVNPGTALQTGWKGIEFVHLTTGAGDDFLDLRGIRAEASRLNRDGWSPLQAGNIFAGGEGNDTFAIDLGSTGQHSFDAHTGTDLLILDWSAATGDIRRTFLGNVGFRYSTNLTRNGVVEEQRVEYFNGDQFQLTGGAGNDELFGGDLDDSLTGGGGADQLSGGGGDDRFRYSALSESNLRSMDRIIDYSLADRIVAPVAATTQVRSAFATITDSDLRREASLNRRLGGDGFGAGKARALQLGSDTLLVINNDQGGYQAGRDLILRLQNFSSSSSAPIVIEAL